MQYKAVTVEIKKYIPEVADRLKRHIVSQDAHIKLACFLNNLPGFVPHLNRDTELGGFICHLETGVCRDR